MRLIAMENGMTVWSAVEPLELPVDLWPPPVQVVQNTESHVSQNNNSYTRIKYKLKLSCIPELKR
jgi:hypothetical protein